MLSTKDQIWYSTIFWSSKIVSRLIIDAISAKIANHILNQTQLIDKNGVLPQCAKDQNFHLCLKCIFKWTWFVKTDIGSVIDRSRIRFPLVAALITYLFSLSFLTRFPSVPLEFPKLANAQPSNFGPLRALRPFLGTFQVSIYPGTGKITILTLLVLSLALFTSDLVIWTTFRLLTLSWLLLLDIELDARPVMQCFDYVFINGQWMYYLPSLKASKKIGFGPCVRPTCPSDLVR